MATTTIVEPQPIRESAGECIKVLLGSSGSQYFIVEENIDDDKSQSFYWRQIPPDFANHVNQRCRQGRTLRSVAMGQDGEWFVCSVKQRDGTAEAAVACGGVSPACKKHIYNVESSNLASLRVAFGEKGSYVLIHNENGYRYGPNLPHGLIEQIKKLNAEKSEITFVRFIRGGCYYVASGTTATYTHPSMCAALKEEMRKPFKDRGRILDMCVAGDGSWIVIRPETYNLSNGVHDEVRTRISNFYSNHKASQTKREEEIKEFRIAMQKRKEREEKEEAAKKRSSIEESLFDVKNKRLKVGDQVTVAGISSSPGDFMIIRIDETGAVQVGQNYYDDDNDTVIRDPRKIVRCEDNSELARTEEQHLLMISDEYEAAVASYYYCVCSDSICHCRRIAPSSSFVSPSLEDNAFVVGDCVLVNRYGQATIRAIEGKNKILVEYDHGRKYYVKETDIRLVRRSAPAPTPPQQHCAFAATCSTSSPKRKKPILEYRGESMPFDEYKCAEKIDMKRLKLIVEDLAKDTTARSKIIQQLEERGSTSDEQRIAHLQRCGDLAVIATTLYNELKEMPTDNSGCVVREVTYEHRDPSFCGRLFAIGETVLSTQSKLPRTTTLQGMHRDLRAPLVGAFAHDVDCENSEVRLLCSLATQYSLQDLVPILFDYRDNRSKWLDLVMQSHNVEKSDAKILANIIISGGRYETWRRRVNASICINSDKVKTFVFELGTQARVLRDQLLKHPRFQWTALEREKLAQQGRKGGAVDIALLPRIIQYCENEVLRILHRKFHSMGWIVRAKIFDGLILEHGTQVTTDLVASLRAAEKSCQVHGWDVRLVEKPLRGMQDGPMPAVTDARAVLRESQPRNS